MTFKTIISVLAVTLALFLTQPLSARTFTAADQAQMVEIGGVVCAPDRAICAFATRRNDVARGVTIFEVRTFAPAADRVPTAEASQASSQTQAVAVFETVRADGRLAGVSQMRWANDNTLTFTARGRETNDSQQVFSLQIDSHRLLQITHSPRDVLDYDMSADRLRVVVATAAHSTRQAGEPLVVNTYEDTRVAADYFFMQYETIDIPSGRQTVIAGCQLAISSTSSSIALSASGHHAVILCSPNVAPNNWLSYEIADAFYGAPYNTVTAGPDGHLSPTNFAPRSFLPQLFLVDTAAATARPLIEAPTPNRATISFSPNERSIVVTGTFPPVSLCGRECPHTPDGLIAYAAEQQTVLQIDIPSLRTRRLDTGGLTVRAASIQWRTPRSFSVVAFSAQVENAAQTRVYTGRRVAVQPAPAVTDSVQFRVHQSATLPPELAAFTNDAEPHRMTHFNEALAHLDLGRVEPVQWPNPNDGSAVTGTLLYPPDYVEGRRYAVVITLYQLEPYMFGAWQQMAARGVLVFQPGGNCWGWTQWSSATQWERDAIQNTARRCVEGAIDFLDSRGLIDRNRVGLAGFSSTGMRTMETLAFTDYKIAAATITDSYSITPFMYALGLRQDPVASANWDIPYPIAQTELLRRPVVGAPLWGRDGIGAWLNRTAFFNLDRVRTPIRWEYHGLNQSDGAWESYAILRRMGQPAEMIVIPGEEHWPRTARGSYAFFEGVADWFDFWLNNHEVSVPEKAEQYRRWRALRDERDHWMQLPRPPFRNPETTGVAGDERQQ